MKFTGRKCSHNDPSLNRESLAGSLRSRTCRPLLSATHPTPYDGLDSVHGRSPVLAVSKSVPWFSFPPDIRAPLVALLPPIAPIRRSVCRTRVFLVLVLTWVLKLFSSTTGSSVSTRKSLACGRPEVSSMRRPSCTGSVASR